MTKELTRKKMALARLQTIMKRQGVPRWRSAYQPAIQAVVGEAPVNSHAFTIPSEKLGREVHVLSRAEQTLATLALYSENLWDLHEQHHLTLAPSPHPLSEHRRWGAFKWPSSSGTVQIAEKLGLATKHPMFTAEINGCLQPIPFPWIGDLLLYLEDAQGAYLVSWDCKTEPGQHGKPGPGTTKTSKHALTKAKTRDLVYVEYMKEMNIPIRRVTGTGIDRAVRSNLLRLAHQHTTPVQLPLSLVAELTWAFREALDKGIPPLEVVSRCTKQLVHRKEALRLLDHQIWNRQLRVDLFSAILPNRPLLVEAQDVLKVHADLFAR